jgi:mRNA interferase RelE/StbE
MPWRGQAVPRYNKRRKKLPPEVQRVLDDVQAAVLKDPFIGERKRGALSSVWVEKFRAENDRYLVAYEIDEKTQTVTFFDIGQHENFYRDLERYKRTRQSDK